MKLSFSTLVCPTWTFQQIVDGAVRHGICGIDFRGIASEIDITQLPQFKTDIFQTLHVLGAHNLRLPCLNLSCTLVTPDDARWTTFLDETHRYAQLAAQTRTKYLRVFGGAVPKDFSRTQAADLAVRHLRQLIKIAQPHGAMILLETHDHWSSSDQVLELVGSFTADEVGVLWDIEHPWRAGENPLHTAQQLQRFIRHVHLKDSRIIDGRNVPTLLGDGELPIRECLAALRSIEYAGWYSLETEKRWRAEAPEPEMSLAQFAEFMKNAMSVSQHVSA